MGQSVRSKVLLPWRQDGKPGKAKRVIASCGAVLALLAVTGCGPVQDELGYPGGVLGRAQDTVIPTTSQTGRAARLALETMMVSSLTAATVATATEAETAQVYINRLYDNVADVQKAAVSKCPDLNVTRDLKFDTTCATADGFTLSGLAFESLSQRADRHLLGLLKTGLDETHLAKAFDDLTQLDLMALFDVLRGFYKDLPMLNEVAASYRDGILILSHAVATGNGCTTPTPETKSACATLRSLLTNTPLTGVEVTLGANKEGRTLASMRKLSLALIDRPGFEWTLTENHIKVIDAHIMTSCQRLAGLAGNTATTCNIKVESQVTSEGTSTPQARFSSAFISPNSR